LTYNFVGISILSKVKKDFLGNPNLGPMGNRLTKNRVSKISWQCLVLKKSVSRENICWLCDENLSNRLLVQCLQEPVLFSWWDLEVIIALDTVTLHTVPLVIVIWSDVQHSMHAVSLSNSVIFWVSRKHSQNFWFCAKFLWDFSEIENFDAKKIFFGKIKFCEISHQNFQFR
jgi:hypothetical protein